MEAVQRKEFLGLLGVQFQVKLLGELLVPNNINQDTNNLFFDEVIELLHPNYFETLDMRRIMVLIKEFYQKNKNAPNIDNIFSMISSTITNEIEKKELIARLEGIQLLWRQYKEEKINNDRRYIKNQTLTFIKQQEFSIVNKEADDKFKNGVVDEQVVFSLSEKYKKIIDIGSPSTYGTTLFDNPESLLIEDYRDPIGIGNEDIDNQIDGGIAKGEFGLVLAGSGIGKTSVLTYIGNNAYINGKNVLHVILEGNKNDVRRRHYSKLFKVRTKDFHLKKQYILDCLDRLGKSKTAGNLVIEKLSGMTPNKLKNWIIKTEEKKGYKFDLICLDYIDCLQADEKTNDKYYNQELVAISLEQIVDEMQWRMYAGIQAKKESNTKPVLDMNDCGGSVERLKKAHLVITLGRSAAQLGNNQINVFVPKCRFAKAGQLWENCIFDGDFLTLDASGTEIKLLDPTTIAEPPQTGYSVNESVQNKSKIANLV